MKNCPVCKSSNLVQVYDNLSNCLECTHIFQTDQTVGVVYDAEYAHKYDNYKHQEMSDLRLAVLKISNLVPGSKVLDVGYGNGSFVKTCTRAEYDAWGTDVHGEDFGIKEVTLAEVSPSQFDCVTFFDSLEHFDDLSLVEHMKPKFVIVSIPNRHEHLMLNPSEWRHYRPGEHLHYFSHHSLSVFMYRWAGYELLYAGYDEDTLRGKLMLGNIAHNNIYTAVYRKIGSKT